VSREVLGFVVVIRNGAAPKPVELGPWVRAVLHPTPLVPVTVRLRPEIADALKWPPLSDSSPATRPSPAVVPWLRADSSTDLRIR
jgi:hypothetical protein